MIAKSKPIAKSEIIEKPGDTQSLEYIFDVLVELVKIAKKADETSLVYYLEMAALEAGEKSSATGGRSRAKQKS